MESVNESVTPASCPRNLRDLWRQQGSPLPGRWREQYPELFDDDDLRLAQGPQRKNHFCEWFAAIYLFQRDGARSLVEKYDTYENHRHNHLQKGHRRKVEEYESVVTEKERQILHAICSKYGVQLPDLLVMPADDSKFSFAEVKGPNDNTLNRPDQRGSREAIRKRLKVQVEIIKVYLVP